ncbi:MAG: DUF3047 domain-containing protein [Gammaproteobacteria bacterium]
MGKWLLAALLAAAGSSANATAQDIPLILADWQPVTFGGIKPTRFKQIRTPDGAGIALTVMNSSSFRVYAFKHPVTVSGIGWVMRYRGLPAVANKEDETSKSGDDFVLRIGLIMAGDHRGVSIFAPGWVKHVAKILKAPAGKVVYLVASRYHAAGATWPSPYSGHLSYVSVAELKNNTNRNWFDVNYTLPIPTRVVGLWLMADGDNTHSDFTAEISRLRIR